MATTTPNYGWPVPTSTDYVKDGATAIEALGDAIDSTLFSQSKGLSFVTGASFTGVTSFSLPTNAFSSTYQNYKMIISLTALTADSDFTVRLRAAGTDNTTANYNSMLLGVSSIGTVISKVNNGATNWIGGESDNTLLRYSWDFDVLSPQVAQQTFLLGGLTYVLKAANAHESATGYCNFAATTQFDSLSFISSVSSSMTGSYKVYGYANS